MKKPTIIIEKLDHIVTLDPEWHKLLEGRKNAKIKKLETHLTKLLKKQGKANTEYEDYKKLKKKLLADIMSNMEASQAGDPSAKALLQKNQKYVDDINEKLERYDSDKKQLPSKIVETNKALLEESMFICYEKLIKEKELKENLESEIDHLREKTLKLISEKDELAESIKSTYGFMHSVAGIEVIEQLDEYYFGGKS